MPGSASSLRRLLEKLCFRGRERYQPLLEDGYSDVDIQQGDLSDDILLEVISKYSTKQDALHIRLVCRLWRKVFDTTVTRIAVHSNWPLPRHSMPHFPNLKFVAIDHGHEGTLVNLMPMLRRSGRIHTLQCSHNTLTVVPDAICDIADLQHLIVTRTAAKAVPAKLHTLAHLQLLDLSGNRLTEVPATIGIMGTLTQLDLSDNQLPCLPEGLCGLTQLKQLNLNNNCLTELPDGLGEMESLTWLSMNNNRLKALPKSMSRLHALTMLGVFASFGHSIRNENNEIVKILADCKMHCKEIHLVAEEVVATLVRHRIKRLRAAAEAAEAAAQGRIRGNGAPVLHQLILS